jgi:hypothetical protein
MSEEFYSVIKLVSGEEIFSLVSVDENEGDPLIILQNPIIMKIIENKNGTYVKVKPWMEIPNDDMYIIKLDKVITMTEIKDNNMIFFYQKYLNDDTTVEINKQGMLNENQVKITDRMGFISTVEDARKRLENIFKDNKES